MESVALGQSEDRTRDRELARRCAAGDESALREILEDHEPRLRKLLYRNLGSLEDAEELAGTTLLKFWRSARGFRGACSLKSYLTRIALNLGRDQARRRRETVPVGADPKVAEEHPYLEKIRMGLLRLGPEDRELLTLYYLEEWDYGEIGDSLGITYDVIRTRLVRARKRLRQIVEEQN